MHGPKNAAGTPGYWGWVGNYFVFAINDGEGMAMKYLQNKGNRPVPSCLGNVPGSGDAFVLHINRQKVFDILRMIATMDDSGQDFAGN